MLVVQLDSNAEHITNDVHLKKASNCCEFLSAQDYSFDIDGSKQHDSQHASCLKDLKSDATHVAVVLGYFNRKDYIGDQRRSLHSQLHSLICLQYQQAHCRVLLGFVVLHPILTNGHVAFSTQAWSRQDT